MSWVFCEAVADSIENHKKTLLRVYKRRATNKISQRVAIHPFLKANLQPSGMKGTYENQFYNTYVAKNRQIFCLL